MENAEADKIPLVDIPTIKQKTITPPGTIGGFTPHPHHPDHLPALRTYATDLADAMKKHEGSVVKIALAENRRRESEQANGSPRSVKNMTFIVVSILLFLVGAGIIGYVIWQQSTPASIPVEETPTLPRSIIQSDEAVALDILGKPATTIAEEVTRITNTPTTRRGTVKNIVPLTFVGRAPLPSTTSDFLSALATHTPPALLRALKPEFMLGVYQGKTNEPFLVLQGTAYDYLYAGMREWEQKLVGDLDDLLGVDTSGTRSVLLYKPFTTTIAANTDVRVVTDADGAIGLLYTFLDPNTIVLTKDPETIIELVRRFK